MLDLIYVSPLQVVLTIEFFIFIKFCACVMPFLNKYNSYNFRTCDGRVLITECSGLAIISAYPLKEVEFNQYTWKGTIWDGEALAGT